MRYQKFLIPQDHSKEAEGVFPSVKDQLLPDAEVILLRVIPPSRTRVKGGGLSQKRSAQVGRRPGGGNRGYRKAERGRSYSHVHPRPQRLAALIKKSIAEEVQGRATVEVKVFRPKELPALADASGVGGQMIRAVALPDGCSGAGALVVEAMDLQVIRKADEHWVEGRSEDDGYVDAA